MEVPTISLEPYFAAEAAAGAGCADADLSGAELAPALAELVARVRQACEEVGFFAVVDHGVDASLLGAQRRECSAFFARPPQCNIIGMVAGGSSRFTWLDFVPSPGCSDGEGEAGAAFDWSLGPVAGRGSMPWRPDTEALAATWLAYYASMGRLVHVLMRIFALALGLPVNAFDEALRGHRSAMRAILYPEVPEADLAAGGGEVDRSPEHTDWGCVTVLLADDRVGGLEIRGKDGAWSPVSPVPGGLLVNLGDLLPFWTEGRWVATPHRVVARLGETSLRRVSVPYFGLVNRATVLAPLLPSEDKGADVRTDVKPLTAGEFFDQHEKYAAGGVGRTRAGGGA